VAGKILIKMKEQETKPDADIFIISYPDTVIKVLNGDIIESLCGYSQLFTFTLTLLAVLENYFSNKNSAIFLYCLLLMVIGN
jgi:hypothetical protein